MGVVEALSSRLLSVDLKKYIFRLMSATSVNCANEP